MTLIMFSLLFLSRASSGRLYKYDVVSDPLILNRNLQPGDRVIVGSNLSYLAVTLNKWEHSEVWSYRQTKDGEIADGPFTPSDDKGGFDFGKFPGRIELMARKKTEISIGAMVFRDNLTFRILSNNPEEELIFSKSSTETLPITKNQLVEYFNTSPGKQTYSILIKTTPIHGRIIFRTNFDKRINIYEGELNTQHEFDVSAPEMMVWTTDDYDQSELVDITINVPSYKPKKYVRMLSNTGKYQVLESYFMEGLDHETIAGLTSGLILFIILLIVISVIIYFVKTRAANKKARQQENAILNESLDAIPPVNESKSSGIV